MTKRKRQVSDFPPEFLDAWALASEGKLRLQFDTEGKARNFRQQLHAFRKAFAEENGQAACAHWWNYDLTIKQEVTTLVVAEKAISSWFIVCEELEWKKQIRDAAKATPRPAAAIANPTNLIPQGLQDAAATAAAGIDPTNPFDSRKAAMDEALDKLGFKP